MRFPLFSRIFIGIGAILFVVALFVRLIFSSWDATGLFFLFSSMVCISLSVILDLQAYYSIFRPRSTRRGLRAAAAIVVLVGLAVLFNYGASQFPHKIDFSAAKSHTLSDYSKKIANSFTDEVEVLYLQIPSNDSKYTDDPVRQAIQMYQDENPKIKFTKINIMDHPELVEKFKLNTQEQALFVTYKDRHERFYKTDENNVTQALVRLLKGRKNIYFSVGHGETKLDNTNARGLASLKKEVERLFYDALEINLENEMLPADTACLVIIGPERSFSERVKAKILEYLKSGGRVFLAFDPIQNPDTDNFLNTFGLKMSKPGIIHQEENALANVGSHVVSAIVPRDATHKVLQGLGTESPVMFYVTGALTPTENSKTSGYTITPLLVSPPTTIMRAGYTKQDKALDKGSFVLMAIAANENKGEIFISADADLFANQFLYQQLNPSFMFNVFSYLSKEEDVIKSRPAITTARDFLVTETKMKLYIGILILPLPILLFSMGGFFWFRRRWL